MQTAQFQRKHLWLGNARIAVFIAYDPVLDHRQNRLAFCLLAAGPIALFIVLVIAHRRVVRAMTWRSARLPFIAEDCLGSKIVGPASARR